MTTEEPKPRRRWLQFSLRTLFVVVTVFCVWMGITAKRAKDQRLAVEAIEGSGGRIIYAHEPRIGLVGPVTPRIPEPPGPEWLRQLIGKEYFFSVVEVQLIGTSVDDASLMAIKQLTDVKTLWLGSTKVTDAGLVHLEGLTNLQELFLGNTMVIDAGIVHFDGTFAPDNSQITDAGLEYLKGLTNLEFLVLLDTQVTGEGVKKLQQALPNCKMNYSAR